MMLGKYRCLDLCDEKGLLAGKLLGDMGADVIKVERPAGDSARKMPPFYQQESLFWPAYNVNKIGISLEFEKPERHDEESLFWQAYNLNKRSISLDIEKPEGQEIFHRLIKTADVVLESFPPGYLDRLGLGYNSLKQVNPRIILTSITPFGQNGPYRDYKASDLVAMSMGGIAGLTGDEDRPPVNVGGPPQSFLFAGAYAMLATLLALYARENGRGGQHVDVSIQQCLVPVTINTVPHWTLNRTLVKRAGHRRTGLTSGATQRQTWRCLDGYVTLTIFGGDRGAKTNRPLVEWLAEENMATDYLKEKDWASFDLAKATAEDWAAIEGPVAEFFARHTMAELFEGAQKRGLMLFPVYETKDLLADRQLQARGFWTNIEHPLLGSIPCPGAFARFSETPLEIRRGAPAIGEHNSEIYHDEMRISEEQLTVLRQKKVI